MSSSDSDLLIVSCLFGTSVSDIFHAPNRSGVCVFMTNQPLMQPTIEKAGWTYQYINFPLSEDAIESSLQAKYTKFMAFRNDFPEYAAYKRILYFDNKINYQDKEVKQIVQQADPSKSILINKHINSNKKTIWDEIDDAIKQPRYKKHMEETIQLIRQRIDNGLMSPTGGELCQTGVLYVHDNMDAVMPLLNKVYSTCKELQQPECQVVWQMFMEEYADEVQIVPFLYVKEEANGREGFGLMVEEYSTYFVMGLMAFVFILVFFFLKRRRNRIRFSWQGKKRFSK